MMFLLLMMSLFALVACKDATGKQTDSKAVEPTASGSAAIAAQSAETNAALEELKKKDTAKGDHEDNDWVPAEFKKGMARWKDTGVYVDGKPIAFMTFGELPITLQPVWVKDKVSQDKPPGCKECKSWKWSQQRFYRFTDYLKALGIDIHKVKVMHVYGPKLSQSVVAFSAIFTSPGVSSSQIRGTRAARACSPTSVSARWPRRARGSPARRGARMARCPSRIRWRISV